MNNRDGILNLTDRTRYHRLEAEVLEKSGLRLQVTTIDDEFRNDDKSIYIGKLISDNKVDCRVNVADLDKIIQVFEAMKQALADKTQGAI